MGCLNIFYEQIKLHVLELRQPNWTFKSNWNRWKYAYHQAARVDVFIEDINNEEKLSRLCRELLYDGLFVIRQLKKSRKNLTGWKWVRVAMVVITDGKVMIKNNKLARKGWWDTDADRNNRRSMQAMPVPSTY